MSIFISTTYLGDGSDTRKAINDLKKSGIAQIELGSNHSGDFRKATIDQIQNEKSTQFIAHNYFLGGDPNFVLNIASTNTQTQNKSVAFIKKTIELCRKLNINYYTVHPGFLGDVSKSEKRKVRNFDFKFEKSHSSKTRADIVNQTIQTIKSLADFSKKNAVQLLVENAGSQTSKDFVIFNSTEELKKLKRGVGQNIKFNFNLAHATLAGIDLKNERIFKYFYDNSLFFEVSEIEGVYDSHLPINPKRGKIAFILKKYKTQFSKRNVILEYRNIKVKEVIESYKQTNKLLNPGAPVI